MGPMTSSLRETYRGYEIEEPGYSGWFAVRDRHGEPLGKFPTLTKARGFVDLRADRPIKVGDKVKVPGLSASRVATVVEVRDYNTLVVAVRTPSSSEYERL